MTSSHSQKSSLSLIPVILSGGVGARLWPVSRDTHPKPFIRLADGQSFLQKTFSRAVALPGVSSVATVTNRDLFFKTEDEFRQINLAHLPTSYVLEPFPRNTAAAIVAAALQIADQYGKEALMLVLPADHFISNQEAFIAAVNQAKNLAHQGYLVTLGVAPTSPHTGYGYIEMEGTRAKRFVEKPSLALAKEYIESGFLWNSGLFCFSAQTILQEMENHCSDLLQAVKQCLQHSRQMIGKDFWHVDLNADMFDSVPNISLDYAVMEKSRQVAVVPCDMGWSDIGSWMALADLTHVLADAHGNRVEGHAILHDVSNCYIRSETRLVGAVGIESLIVIDTPDGLLVADKSRTQDVKHLYLQLKNQDRTKNRSS